MIAMTLRLFQTPPLAHACPRPPPSAKGGLRASKPPGWLGCRGAKTREMEEK